MELHQRQRVAGQREWLGMGVENLRPFFGASGLLSRPAALSGKRSSTDFADPQEDFDRQIHSICENLRNLRMSPLPPIQNIEQIPSWSSGRLARERILPYDPRSTGRKNGRQVTPARVRRAGGPGWLSDPRRA